jgi:glycine/D-amino acid oxidase-like deaminating enzyme
MLDRRGGNLNPLSYARGLAQAARRAGAKVCGGSPVLSLRREGAAWVLATPQGTVRAGRVVIATNGYTGPLWPGLAQSIVPVFSGITATEPLPPEVAASILPSRSSLYEISARYIYYRVDEAGRFLMGGRSVMRDTHEPADYAVLVRHARELFPALASVRWTHCWNGQVAVTPDELPHLHEPEPGLAIALGYNGRGVAMATAVGRMLARRMAGAPAEALDLPVTPVRPMPLHGFWRIGVAAEMAWSAMKERLAG